MAPKPDPQTDRINTLETRVGGLASAFEEMRRTADAREQRAVEAEQRAEERERRAEETPRAYGGEGEIP